MDGFLWVCFGFVSQLLFIPKDFLALFGKITFFASSLLQKRKGRANLLGLNPDA